MALTSQCGGIGMAILGFSRSTKMGVSAIVGLGNKADIDEDDLLTFFEQDEQHRVHRHAPGGPQGRPGVRRGGASGSSRQKPVVVLKAGRTAQGAKAAGSHTGALAGDDKVYDDILRQGGVIRAPGLNDMLEYARGAARAAHAEGRERRHHHRRRRLGRAAVRRLRRQRARR